MTPHIREIPGRPVMAQQLAAVQLDDKYTLEEGRVYLTGIQALVRLPLMQRQLDDGRVLIVYGPDGADVWQCEEFATVIGDSRVHHPIYKKNIGGFLRFLVPPAPNIRRGDADSACAAELQRRTARVARPGHVPVPLSRSASVKSKGSRVPRRPTTVGVVTTVDHHVS
mgnify:CR=1 FL=1